MIRRISSSIARYAADPRRTQPGKLTGRLAVLRLRGSAHAALRLGQADAALYRKLCDVHRAQAATPEEHERLARAAAVLVQQLVNVQRAMGEVLGLVPAHRHGRGRGWADALEVQASEPGPGPVPVEAPGYGEPIPAEEGKLE